MKKGNNYNEDYERVATRMKTFKKEYPNHAIITEIMRESYVKEKHEVIIRAMIFDPNNRLLATGTALEREGFGDINETSWLENCETSAIGRAFKTLGLGDSDNFATEEEVKNAKSKQGSIEKNQAVNKGKELVEKARGGKPKKEIDLSFITEKTPRSKTSVESIAKNLAKIGITKTILLVPLKNYDKDGKYKTMTDFFSNCSRKDLVEFLESVIKK
jgi:hypothetical protein